MIEQRDRWEITYCDKIGKYRVFRNGKEFKVVNTLSKANSLLNYKKGQHKDFIKKCLH